MDGHLLVASKLITTLYESPERSWYNLWNSAAMDWLKQLLMVIVIFFASSSPAHSINRTRPCLIGPVH